MQSAPKLFEESYFRYILVICLLAVFSAIGMYAYLGTFSRYMADDYCEASLVRTSSPIQAVINRYMAGATRASNRYSNLFFVGISETLGSRSIQITIVSMALLWVIGLCWCIHEIRRFLMVKWILAVDIFLGMMLGFFSYLQAPNLFQSVYWRSSMMTHFAPLVFSSFLSAFVVRQLSCLRLGSSSPLVYAVVFFSALVIAGFSEPPTTTLLTLLPLLMAAVWLWEKPPVKQRHLALLAWTFAGVFLGFLVLLLSPAGADVARNRQIDFSGVFIKSFYYSWLFISDSLKTSPLPALISLLIAFLLSWLYKQDDTLPWSRTQQYIILLVIITAPILMWLLIAAGFAPSVYGQSYPIERMRFLAQTMLITALMLEGALFGCLLKDLRLRHNKNLGQWVALAFFAVLAIGYPLRAAFNIYKSDVPEYRAYAEKWDMRDAQIRSAVEQGKTDLVVVQLDSMGGVREYKDDVRHWINVCAARYYGLHTLAAP